MVAILISSEASVGEHELIDDFEYRLEHEEPRTFT
jgi:hypothetical protein